MKTINVFLLLIGSVFTARLEAENKEITTLTAAYYGIKDALVADDAANARTKASEFLLALEQTTKIGFTSSQLKVWSEQVKPLNTASSEIAATSDIEKQRARLNALSVSLFAVLKAFNGNGSVVYYQYCPMKKAYWLSREKKIENPYYGSKMLSCGKVTETLR